MPHEAEARPVTLGSRMLETAFLCRLRRHDLVACPSLWVSVSHIDGTGEIMTSEVRRIGGLPPPAPDPRPPAANAAPFHHMTSGQGYAPTTTRPPPLPVFPARLTAAEVVTFVTGWASCRSPAYGQAMVYALRNLLRYLHARGLLSHALAEAVPTVPGWKPARAVRAVTGQQMAALLACCDRHSAIGRRDYAIVLLLTRLGLRASEVAGITLAGIDWRQGVLRVRGQGNILAELPLPAVISSFQDRHVVDLGCHVE